LSLPCSIWEEKGKTKMGSVAKKGLQQYMLQLQQHPLRTKVCIWKPSLRFFMCILVCFGFGFDGLLWLRKKSMKVWIFSSFFLFFLAWFFMGYFGWGKNVMKVWVFAVFWIFLKWEIEVNCPLDNCKCFEFGSEKLRSKLLNC
jgi:hypothetical protein